MKNVHVVHCTILEKCKIILFFIFFTKFLDALAMIISDEIDRKFEIECQGSIYVYRTIDIKSPSENFYFEELNPLPSGEELELHPSKIFREECVQFFFLSLHCTAIPTTTSFN